MAQDINIFVIIPWMFEKKFCCCWVDYCMYIKLTLLVSCVINIACLMKNRQTILAFHSFYFQYMLLNFLLVAYSGPFQKYILPVFIDLSV